MHQPALLQCLLLFNACYSSMPALVQCLLFFNTFLPHFSNSALYLNACSSSMHQPTLLQCLLFFNTFFPNASMFILLPPQPMQCRKAGSKQLDDGSLYNDPTSLNENDPNFDSEDDGGEYPVFGSLHREAIGNSRLTLTQYKKLIGPHILEYFVSGDCDEVARNIMEIETPEYTYEFVKRLINMSLDQTDKERELVSQLLAAVHPDVFSSSMIGRH
jgi:hypothetical protein